MEPHKTVHKLTRNQAFASNKKLPVKSHRFIKFLGLIIVLFLGVGASYLGRVYFAAIAAAQQSYHRNGNSAMSTAISEKKPVSILILGVDQGIEGRKDRGNSDTMILVTINPQKQKSTMTSIPRDLLVDVKGDKNDKYYMSRVNSAYEVGGSQASVKTVTQVLNVPINYYMEVNMRALEGLVNSLGGVDVDVPFSFTYNTVFTKGEQHLNGKQALDYVRMRHDDPRGDYGRQMRQRQVITQIVHKGLSLKSISNYRKILNVISKYVQTNLTFNDMLAVAMNYRSAAQEIKSDYIHGHDAWIAGASIQVAPTKELQRVSDEVRTNLNLKRAKLHNEETRQNRLQKGLDWQNPNAFTNYIIYAQHSDTEPWNGNN